MGARRGLPHVRRAASLVALAIVAFAPLDSVHAQLAAGAASSVPPPAGTAPLRWPDVAYDRDHDVYLAVSGAGLIAGYWFSGDGTPIDVPFTIGGGSLYAQAPRVAYAGGAGMMLAWHETLPGSAVRIRGRVIRFGGAPSADFDVSPVGTNWEMGAALAWSSASAEMLVAWQALGDTRIGAQRVSATGALVGPAIVIDPRPYYFRDPAVAYHAATDTFFVAYAGCVGANDCFVDVQRVRAGTGELVGGPIELDASIAAGYVPELAYASITEDVLVVWHRRAAGAASFVGRIVHGNGTAAATTTLVSDTLGSYDANGLAYSAASGTFVFVTHGTTSQDVAIELSSSGVPLGVPIPFGAASAGGNFNPRVASRGGHAEWLAVTSSDFTMLGAQRLLSSTTDPSVLVDAGARDAGSVGSDAGPPVLDAGAHDAGTISLDAMAGLDGGRPRVSASGCGCRVDGAAPRAFPVGLGIALALACLRGGRRPRR